MISIRAILSPLGSAAFVLGIVACGSGETTTSASSSSSSSSGSGGDSSSTGTGGTGTGTGGGTGGAADMSEHDAFVIGTLANPDLAKAKAAHDMIAMGGEPQANALGDFSHAVLLGTTILGTKQNEFLALDRWHGNNLDKLYGDPMFQAAFGALFSPAPTLEKYKRQTAWMGYGDLDSGKPFTPHFFAVFRGTLKDPATAQQDHDAAVAAAMGQAMAAGDVAHAAFLGRDDPTKAAFIDIWKDSASIMAVYSDPSFQAVFAKIFTTMPAIGIYQSTDWHQW